MTSFKRNLFYSYASSGLNGLFGLLSVPLGLYYLGVSGYGLFSIYGVLSSYVALIDLGVTKNFVRVLASQGDDRERVRQHRHVTGLYLLLATGLFLSLPLLMIVVPAWIFPVPAPKVAQLRWIVLAVVAEYALAIPTVMRQMRCIAEERFDLSAHFAFVSGCCRFALMFAGMILWGNPALIVGLMVSRRLIELYTGPRILGRLPPQAFRPSFDLREFKTIISRSAALSVAQALQSVMTTLGSLLINRYYGLAALGTYRAAFDLANKVWFFSNGIGSVAFPTFARMLADRGGRQALCARLARITDLSWAGFNLVNLVGFVAAPGVLAMMRITQPKALELFILILFGICLNAHSNLSYSFLQAAGRYKLGAVVSALALCAMWMTFEWLRTTAGILAIGWGWIVSQFFYALLADTLAARISAVGFLVHIEAVALRLILFVSSLLVVAGSLADLPVVVRIMAAFVVLAAGVIAAYRFQQGSDAAWAVSSTKP